MSSSILRTAFIPKRPIGAFRGSLLGFLAGVATVSAAGYYTLFDKVKGMSYTIPVILSPPTQYMTAASMLQQSVDEIKTSSLALRAYSARLEALEERCTELSATAATKAALESVQTDAKALYVGVTHEQPREELRDVSQNETHLTSLDIKRAVWSLEEDMRELMRDRRTRVVV